jgi:hypothetical protein
MSPLLHRSARALRAIVIALAVVSCSADLTGPAALVGSYRLSLYNGAVMPVTLSEFTGTSFLGGSFPCRSRFSGAALIIDAAANAIASDTLRVTCDDGSPDVVVMKSSTGSVSVSGDTTIISYPVSGLYDSYRTFARRSGTDILVFRTETEERLVTSTGSPAGTKRVVSLTPRLYVVQP